MLPVKLPVRSLIGFSYHRHAPPCGAPGRKLLSGRRHVWLSCISSQKAQFCCGLRSAPFEVGQCASCALQEEIEGAPFRTAATESGAVARATGRANMTIRRICAVAVVG